MPAASISQIHFLDINVIALINGRAKIVIKLILPKLAVVSGNVKMAPRASISRIPFTAIVAYARHNGWALIAIRVNN
jgi:hypothetical protein